MDEKQWKWLELREGKVFSREGFELCLMPLRGNLLVSGDVSKAFKYLDLDVPILGMEGLAKDNFALAIGRNKVLVSTQHQMLVRNGWYEEGFMISSADFQWKLLSLNGPATRMILAQSIQHDLSSPSCITMVFGKVSLVVKSESGYLLFVEAPYLQYFMFCLESCAII